MRRRRNLRSSPRQRWLWGCMKLLLLLQGQREKGGLGKRLKKIRKMKKERRMRRKARRAMRRKARRAMRRKARRMTREMVRRRMAQRRILWRHQPLCLERCSWGGFWRLLPYNFTHFLVYDISTITLQRHSLEASIFELGLAIHFNFKHWS